MVYLSNLLLKGIGEPLFIVVFCRYSLECFSLLFSGSYTPAAKTTAVSRRAHLSLQSLFCWINFLFFFIKVALTTCSIYWPLTWVRLPVHSLFNRFSFCCLLSSLSHVLGHLNHVIYCNIFPQKKENQQLYKSVVWLIVFSF